MRLLNLISKACEVRQYKHPYLKRMYELMNDRLRELELTQYVILILLGAPGGRKWIRKLEQYHQIAKMEEQERTQNLKHWTSQSGRKKHQKNQW